ncbi:MAG: hypothetical protein QOE16_1658 [Microbacteriaceae bacterium]|jgi:hypothetical protein|nr:hypothetical protein [Microbacteriaceae bacterium]
MKITRPGDINRIVAAGTEIAVRVSYDRPEGGFNADVPLQ